MCAGTLPAAGTPENAEPAGPARLDGQFACASRAGHVTCDHATARAAGRVPVGCRRGSTPAEPAVEVEVAADQTPLPRPAQLRLPSFRPFSDFEIFPAGSIGIDLAGGAACRLLANRTTCRGALTRYGDETSCAGKDELEWTVTTFFSGVQSYRLA